MGATIGADGSVKINFVGDESDLKRAAKGANDALDGVEKKTKSSLSGVATGIAAVGGVTALAGGLMAAANAAQEDEAAQVSLAKTLQNVTGATKDQVSEVEKFIAKTQNATGVLDDELRPAFDALVRGTGDVAQSQKLLGLAMDISAGTGKDLTQVTEALSKAANGNMKSLKALDPALTELIKDGATTDEVFAALGQTFEGQTAAKANTTAGQMAILKARMADLQEEIGARVNVALLAMAGFIQDKLIPAVSSIVQWMKEHKEIVMGVGIAIGVVLVAAFLSWAAAAAAAAASTLLAMAPLIAIVAVIAAVVAAVIYAYTHWDWFRNTVDAVASFITGTLVPAFQSIWAFIRDKVIPIVTDIITKFVEFQTKVFEVATEVSAKLVAVFEAIKAPIEAAAKFVLDKIDTMLGPLDELLAKLGRVPGFVGVGGTSVADIAKQKQAAAAGSPSMTAILTVDGSVITKAQIDQDRKYN